MPTTIHSLSSEVLLDILGYLVPIVQTDDIDLAWYQPGRNDLLATSLVDRRLGQLAQQVLFRSVHFERRSQARRWRETAAGVHTREFTVSFRPEWMVTGAGRAFRPLPLTELFAPTEVHAAVGGWPRITTVDVEMADDLELAGSLVGIEMLEGLESLRISPHYCPLAFEPFFARLRALHVNLFHPGGFVPLSPGAFPHLTHLTLFRPPIVTDMFAFPSLRSLTIVSFGRASLDPLLAALAAAPPSLTRFATRARLPLAVLEALPTTITELAVKPTVLNQLQAVLDRWFDGHDRAEVGRLRRLVALGRSEGEVAWRWTSGTLERVRREGCEVACSEKVELEWRA